MKCLKCGKDTNREQVFCDHCLDGMAAYPVKPGTHIHLPKQATDTSSKKPTSRKRIFDIDESLLRYKKAVRWLAAVITLLVLALGLTTASLVLTQKALEEAKQAGKNFTVEVTQEQSSAP